MRRCEAVVAALRDVVGRGIVTHVTDGFTAGARGALELSCAYPTGGRVVEPRSSGIRDGRIARWSGVPAWDEWPGVPRPVDRQASAPARRSIS